MADASSRRVHGAGNRGGLELGTALAQQLGYTDTQGRPYGEFAAGTTPALAADGLVTSVSLIGPVTYRHVGLARHRRGPHCSASCLLVSHDAGPPATLPGSRGLSSWISPSGSPPTRAPQTCKLSCKRGLPMCAAPSQKKRRANSGSGCGCPWRPSRRWGGRACASSRDWAGMLCVLLAASVAPPFPGLECSSRFILPSIIAGGVY